MRMERSLDKHNESIRKEPGITDINTVIKISREMANHSQRMPENGITKLLCHYKSKVR
jgi:hypothetical protein